MGSAGAGAGTHSEGMREKSKVRGSCFIFFYFLSERMTMRKANGEDCLIQDLVSLLFINCVLD